MKPISAVRLAACFVAVLCTAMAGITMQRNEGPWAIVMLFWAIICLVIAIEEDQKY